MTFHGAMHRAENLAGTVRLTLTGEFELIIAGARLAIPHSVERVLAYLALTERPVNRTKMAGALWFDASEEHAANNLRTALWRLGRACGRLVSADPERLALSSAVAVDATELFDLAHRLIQGPEPEDLRQVSSLVARAELLPDWNDDWVVADRERFRLLRLEALEHAAEVLIERRCFGQALIAALASVQTEPLRESSRRLVVAVHAAEGNLAEALRSYEQYRLLLRDELGIGPSRLMLQQMASLTPRANG